MFNVLGKLADKIGVVVQSGGILNLENFNFQGSPQNPRPRSEQLLLQQVQAEVFIRLKQSLHNQVFINLGKEEQFQQVKRPWDFEVKLGNQVNERLDSSTTILDVFDRNDIQGRLLILGKPGSGKTTTLLDLAQYLLKRSTTNSDELIPVLVNLSSWASKRQPIPEWLVEELKIKYGVRKDIGKKWLQEQKLLVLLDGLDEVRSEYQEACVKKLNQWIGGNSKDLISGQLVICSRIEEYELLATPLQMNGAICLVELSSQQIEKYLKSVGRSQLWALVSQNQTINDLVCFPLFLSMVVIADQVTPGELQTLEEDKARAQLLDIYVCEMLGRAKSYTRWQVRSWLIWIAQQLEREQQTEFLVEKIQPTWLQSNKLECVYQRRLDIYTALSYSLFPGLLVGFLSLPFNKPYTALMSGLIIMLLLFLFFVLSLVLSSSNRSSKLSRRDGTAADYYYEFLAKITLSEGLDWSWKKAWDGLILFLGLGLLVSLFIGLFFGLLGGLIGGLLLGLFFGLLFGLVDGLKHGLIVCLFLMLFWWLFFVMLGGLIGRLFSGLGDGLIFGLTGGLIFALIGGLIGGIQKCEINQKVSINQGFWQSLWKNLILSLLSGLIGGLLSGLIGGLIGGLGDGLIFGLAGGLIFVLIGSIGVGELLKHAILREILYSNGLAPWNYAHFLVECSDCLLLQQVGGRFRFIHKTVQEHFAAMSLEKS